MLSILISLLLVGNAYAEECGTSKLKWHACSVDEDCVLISEVSSGLAAVNGKYKAEAEALNACIAQRIECDTTFPGTGSPVARCRSSKCIVGK